MAPRLISLAFAALLAHLAIAQPFGRFGYGEPADLPGLTLNRQGFCAKAPGASTFEFLSPGSTWRPLVTTDAEQTVMLDGGEQSPTKASFNLYSSGLRLYFPKGFALKITSSKNPFLTWPEGSVGDGVPTPDFSWILVSFQDDEPPVLVSLEGGPSKSFVVQGKPGDWTLTTDSEFDGWVHLCLPLGTRAFKTTGAASLGAVAQRFGWETSVWLAPPAKLLGKSVSADEDSVTCTWHFDRAGVFVPTPAILASLGGYPITVTTRIRQLQALNEEGPVAVTAEPDLTIRFPIRRVPSGRFLAEGKPSAAPPTKVAPFDLPTVVELGMSNLTCTCDLATRKLGEDTLAGYFDSANYFLVPATGSRLPYNAAGAGLDTAAADAFLQQALTSTREASSASNALLTSVMWRRDWMTWRLWTNDPGLSRRSEAIAALAGALCPEPERRLDAAMLQAGMAAERGLGVFWKKSGLTDSVPEYVEPMEGVRQVLFALDSRATGLGCSFARAMLSDIRVYGSIPVSLVRNDGNLEITWDGVAYKGSDFVLAAAYPLTVEAKSNVTGLSVKDAFGLTQVRFKRQGVGPCSLKLSTPDFVKPPPTWIDVPQYTEVSR